MRGISPEVRRVNPKNFFAELQRRHVYKVGAAYAVAGWLVVQIVTQVFPIFEISALAQRIIVLLIVAGFPVALVLAWLFDITAQGIVRTGELPPSGEAPEVRRKRLVSDRKLNYVLGALLIVAIAYFAAERFGLIGGSRKTSIGTTAINSKSIAVLPFENLSEDKANAYFATGIQDEILTRIAKIGALKVISRSSTKQYESRPDNLSEIAHELGVANVLEGSVQRAAGQVHVNVQLISAATDEHLWAESYDRKLENIFGVEAEVATAVAEALKAKLTGPEQQALEQQPTNNPEAYDAYLRAVALWADFDTIDDASKATRALDDAVRLDPNFAVAWALLAQIHSMWYFWIDPTPARRAAAHKSLETAVRLRPDSPDVQLAEAYYQFWVRRDFDGARRTLELLQSKWPNNSDIAETLEQVAIHQGQWDKAPAYINRAIGLNPRNRGLRAEAAWALYRATRDFSNALKGYDQALEIWPDDKNLIAGKASVFQSLGELDRADELLKQLRPAAKDGFVVGTICDQAKLRRRYSDGVAILRSFLNQADSLSAGERDSYRRSLADLQRLSGDLANANVCYAQLRGELERKLTEQADDADSNSELATVCAGLGDKQLATRYIERAISLRPAAEDAFVGPAYEEKRARIAARFAQKDVAIPILEHLLKTPYVESITPALLRLDPDFDALRGDPRFEKLCEDNPR